MEIKEMINPARALCGLICSRTVENPIKRETLVRMMNAQGFGIGDRSMRNLVTKTAENGVFDLLDYERGVITWRGRWRNITISNSASTKPKIMGHGGDDARDGPIRG